MKRRQFTEDLITYALRQVGLGHHRPTFVEQFGCSEASFYIWRPRYESFGMMEGKELQQLRDEDARLKRLVGNLTLDNLVLSEVVQEALKVTRGRSLATWVVSAFRSQ